MLTSDTIPGKREAFLSFLLQGRLPDPAWPSYRPEACGLESNVLGAPSTAAGPSGCSAACLRRNKQCLAHLQIVWSDFLGSRVCAKSLSRVRLFATPWTVARQAPLSMGFSRQEYWNGSPFPPSGDLPHPGIEPVSLTSPLLAGGFFTTSTTWEALYYPKTLDAPIPLFTHFFFVLSWYFEGYSRLKVLFKSRFQRIQGDQ